MKLNKKGDDLVLSLPVKLLFFLVVAGVLIFLGKTVLEIQQERAVLEECRLSFLALDKIGKVNEITDWYINCPRVNKKIDKGFLDKGELDLEKVNDLLSREMYDCYSKTAGGKLNPFENYNGDNTLCIICSQISFDEELYGQTITGFYDYLYTHRAPGSKKYMSEALFGRTASSSDLTLDYDINPDNNPLYVIYRADLYNSFGKLFGGTFAGSAGTAIAGCITGAAAGTFVIPVIGTATGCLIGLKLGAVGGAIGGGVMVYTSPELSVSIDLVPGTFISQPFTKDGKESKYCGEIIN